MNPPKPELTDRLVDLKADVTARTKTVEARRAAVKARLEAERELTASLDELDATLRRALKTVDASRPIPDRDPGVAPDGKCYVCAGARAGIAVAEHDPFCSTDCAKTYHNAIARRLGLLPRPRTLIDDANRLLVLTEDELLWIVDDVVPLLDRRRRQPDDEEAA